MMHLVVDRQDISTGDIHVWIACIADDCNVTAKFLPILSQEERAKAAHFVFDRDRQRYVQTHGIVRRILADYSGIDAATLTFIRNRHGKPHLAGRPNGQDLQFSLSHSGNCCLVAVRLDHPVGVDVENVRELPQAAEIAQRYFTADEVRFILALPGEAQRNAFFDLWTHKEAIVKGLGVGLAANLQRIVFELDPVQGLRLAARDGDPSIGRTWSIFRLDPTPGYVAAVASGHSVRSLTLKNWNRTDPD
jgi:4'-phosphopantetheinyl transferase